MIKPGGTDFSLESGATNKEKSTYLSFSIPLRKLGKLQYSADNGEVPKYQKHCLAFGVIAYDAYATAGTDNIASMAVTSRFYFKDP